MAECSYSPKGNGWSYKQDEHWTWNKILVNPEKWFSQANEARRIDSVIPLQDISNTDERIDKIAEVGKIDRDIAWKAIWSAPTMIEADIKNLPNVSAKPPQLPDMDLLQKNNIKIQNEVKILLEQLEEVWDTSTSYQEKNKTGLARKAISGIKKLKAYGKMRRNIILFHIKLYACLGCWHSRMVLYAWWKRKCWKIKRIDKKKNDA